MAQPHHLPVSHVAPPHRQPVSELLAFDPLRPTETDNFAFEPTP